MDALRTQTAVTAHPTELPSDLTRALMHPCVHLPVLVRLISLLPPKMVDDVEAVEALLEVYFMKSDFLMKRLSVLKDKVEDYEDLINIDLDSRRNDLFKVDILLTCGK